jgi:P pilus assembly chaperone PapD
MIAPFSRAAVDLGAVRGIAGAKAKVVFTLLNDDGNPILGEREVAVTSGHSAPH